MDPIVVNLREKTPYYYEFGIQVASLLDDETLIPELRRSMTLRYRLVLDRSLNSRNEDTTKFTQKLTNSEQFLFKAGNRCGCVRSQGGGAGLCVSDVCLYNY